MLEKLLNLVLAALVLCALFVALYDMHGMATGRGGLLFNPYRRESAAPRPAVADQRVMVASGRADA